MSSEDERIIEAQKDIERIRSTFDSLPREMRQSAPGLRQTLAALERDLGQLSKAAERYADPLAKLARGEELTNEERQALKLG